MPMEGVYNLVYSLVQSLHLALSIVLVIVGAIYHGFIKFTSARKLRLPPGTLGLPLFGESISFLKAQKCDKTQEWLQCRIRTHGPIFKTSLIGKPTIVITGSAGNRFVFTADENTIASNPVTAITKIMGKYNIFELSGKVHRMMRGAVCSFLTTESLQRCAGEMDMVIRQHLFQELAGRDYVKAVPLLKRITYNVACTVLFGLAITREHDLIFEEFTAALKGMWAMPVNLPHTSFRRALVARRRLCSYFSKLIQQQRRRKLAEGNSDDTSNVVGKFMNLKDDSGENIPDEMIVDNMLTLMIGSHDTNAIVLSHFMRLLARNRNVYQQVLGEHERILNEKEEGNLTWKDIQKMKYTWRVALEIMRITPPVFGSFRRAIRDTSYGGFDIPKGWQVFWVASATHMDESIFAEPHEFDPSRFQDSLKSFPPYSYLAFGAGARMCPGADFARTEILLVVHHFVTNFEWSEMVPDEPITRDPMPYPAMGLPIKLCRKKKENNDACLLN